MSRSRHQLPKGARGHVPRKKGSHIGQADSVEAMQAQSIARRYARTDRHRNPLHCHVQRKLMYDSEEIAKSTAEALQRLCGMPYYVYQCPRVNHWHLTTTGPGEVVSA